MQKLNIHTSVKDTNGNEAECFNFASMTKKYTDEAK